MAVTGGYDQSGSYPAAVDRRIVAAALAHASGTALSVRSGVIAGAGQQLAVSASSGMNVSVGTGRAVISATSGGAYQVINDAALTLTLGASTSQPRIDLVVARFRDSELGDGAPVGPAIEVVAGTPAASPVAPSPGSRAVALAQIAVGASVSSITSGNITDTRQYTGPGGPVRIPGALASTPAAMGVPEGVEVYDPTAGAVAVAVGGGWLPLGGSRQGAVAPGTVAVSNGGTIGTVTIGPFPVKMDVVVQYQGYGGYRADNASNVAAATTATTVTGSSGHTIIDRGANSVGGGMAAVGYRPVVAGASILGLQAGGSITTLVKAACSGPADNATTYGYQFLSWTATPSA